MKYNNNASELAVSRLLKIMVSPSRIFNFSLKSREAFGFGLKFCQLIAEGVSFRVVPSRKSDNSLKNSNKKVNRICPNNLLGQKCEREQDNTHKMYTQEVKINFQDFIIFYYVTYVLDQSSNSVPALK